MGGSRTHTIHLLIVRDNFQGFNVQRFKGDMYQFGRAVMYQACSAKPMNSLDHARRCAGSSIQGVDKNSPSSHFLPQALTLQLNTPAITTLNTVRFKESRESTPKG